MTLKDFYKRLTQFFGRIGQLLVRIVWNKLPNGLRHKLTTSTAIYQVSKITELGFGDVTYLRDEGVETYFCFKIDDSLNNSYTFLWGSPENFTSEKVDAIVEKLNQCIDILQETNNGT